MKHRQYCINIVNPYGSVAQGVMKNENQLEAENLRAAHIFGTKVHVSTNALFSITTVGLFVSDKAKSRMKVIQIQCHGFH
jgi:hypothetical protein